MPRVYNRNGDEEIPADAVYVGRPSRFGNPFVIGPDGTREEVLASYRQWIEATPEGRAVAAAAAEELAGRDLVCYCVPEACHADVLLEIANPVESRD